MKNDPLFKIVAAIILAGVLTAFVSSYDSAQKTATIAAHTATSTHAEVSE